MVLTSEHCFVRREAQEEVKEQSLHLEKEMELLESFHNQYILYLFV